ncbi:uncharacterized protein STEHIDRAFT_42883, partial [Stereum hirsutum FP-91666 SS1]|uniref:uncharacterized protein n=1 Tax=Stereum hirsutum (strain FP-91666) TaxID=721885 RepID=UPI000444A8FA
TSQRLGKIPLVIGMPVVISHNFDVDGGIVNGSTGILKKIRFYVDEQGDRHLRSCVVEVLDSTDEKLPLLPEHHVAVLEDTTDM